MPQNFTQSLSELSSILQIPYHQLYKHKYAPELQKTHRGYDVEQARNYIENLDNIKREEAAAEALIQSEDELLEKQIKLETARHKCKLLELEIKKKEGNLIDVNFVIESRTKELMLLKKLLNDLIKNAPKELTIKTEEEISEALTNHINSILSSISELIQDDWQNADYDSDEETTQPQERE